MNPRLDLPLEKKWKNVTIEKVLVKKKKKFTGQPKKKSDISNSKTVSSQLYIYTGILVIRLLDYLKLLDDVAQCKMQAKTHTVD